MKELYVAPSEKDVLLSSGAPYQLMAFGIFASMVLSFQGGILEWILGFSLVALVLQALWFFSVRVYRRRLVEAGAFTELVKRAQQKLRTKRRVEVWTKDEKESLIAGAATPFYSALLVSPSAVDAILKHPDYGEAVLAARLARIERTQLTLRTILATAGFVFFALSQSTSGTFIVYGFPQIPSYIPLELFAVCISYPWGFLAVVMRKLEDCWRNDVVHCYGIQPEIAIFQVFAPQNYDDMTGTSVTAGFEGRTGSEGLLRRAKMLFGISVILGVLVYLFIGTAALLTPTETGPVAILLAGFFFTVTTGMSAYAPSHDGGLRTDSREDYYLLDDEKSNEVRHAIERDLGVNEVRISGYGEDGIGAIEVSVSGLGRQEFLSPEQWDALEEPTLASVYLGVQFENSLISGPLNKAFAVLVVFAIAWILWMIVTASLYVAGSWLAGPAAVILCSWIAVDVLCFAVVTTRKDRRVRENDVRHALSGPLLLDALEKLAAVTKQDEYGNEYSRRAARIRRDLALRASQPDDFSR